MKTYGSAATSWLFNINQQWGFFTGVENIVPILPKPNEVCLQHYAKLKYLGP